VEQAADEDELLLLAQKVPDRIRKRVLERPDAFGKLAGLDDEALDRVLQDVDATSQDTPARKRKAGANRR
jgi:hypothetical protein